MATEEFEFTGEVKLTYDENSPEFQAALTDFRNGDDTVSARDMLKYIASCLTTWGDHERHLPDFGYYVALEGSKPEGEPYCGVQVENTYDDRHFN
jgi:hypothetical protein